MGDELQNETPMATTSQAPSCTTRMNEKRQKELIDKIFEIHRNIKLKKIQIEELQEKGENSDHLVQEVNGLKGVLGTLVIVEKDEQEEKLKSTLLEKTQNNSLDTMDLIDRSGMRYSGMLTRRKKKCHLFYLNYKIGIPGMLNLSYLLKNKRRTLLTDVKLLKADMKNSHFFREFKVSFSTIIKKWMSIEECCFKRPVKKKMKKDDKQVLYLAKHNLDQEIHIICYGLGSFTYDSQSRHQLAFLLTLQDFLKVKRVSIYDPIFSEEERRYLSELGWDVLSVNEKGKKTVSSKTIFYMPHCDLEFYNNLLWFNWNPNAILNTMIIGNSLSVYKQSFKFNARMEKYFESLFYMNTAVSFLTEVKILNAEFPECYVQYQVNEAMADTSVHYFTHEAVSKVSPRVWRMSDKPVYLGDKFS